LEETEAAYTVLMIETS